MSHNRDMPEDKKLCKYLDYIMEDIPICKHPKWKYRGNNAPCIEKSVGDPCIFKEVDETEDTEGDIE